MKKVIAGILLGIATLSFLCACDYDQFRNGGYTHDPNCTCTCSCCEEARGHTRTKTTDEHGNTDRDYDIDDIASILDIDIDDFTRSESINVLESGLGELRKAFYAGYPEARRVSARKDIMDDGTIVNWICSEGILDTSAYYKASKIAIESGLIDVIMTDWTTPLYECTRGDYIIDLSSFDLDYSDQYDIGIDEAGKRFGTSFYVTPGTLVVDMDKARNIYGSSITYGQMASKLTTNFDSFKQVAEEAKIAGYKMIIGPSDWSWSYFFNDDLHYENDKLVVGHKTLDYIMDTKYFSDNNYFAGANDSYALWGYDWNHSFGTTLCYYSCPWFDTWCFTDQYIEIQNPSNLDLRAIAPKANNGWRWGGAVMSVTNRIYTVQEKENTIRDFIYNTTLKEETLYEVANLDGDIRSCPNSRRVLESLTETEPYFQYYGGQNLFSVYKEAIENNDYHNYSREYEYNQFYEAIQAGVRMYINGQMANPFMFVYDRDIEVTYDENYLVL